jgi:hypothetical protein
LENLLEVAYDTVTISNNEKKPSIIIETVFRNSETDVTPIEKQFEEIVLLAKSGPLILRRLNKAVKGVMVLSSRVSSYKTEVISIKDRVSFVCEHLDITIGRTSNLEGMNNNIQKLVNLNDNLVSDLTTHLSKLTDRVNIQETRMFQMQSDYMNRHIANDTIVLKMCQFTMMLMGCLVIVGGYILM